MGLFAKRERSLVPNNVLASLAAYGEASLQARRSGQPLIDPRFDWQSFLGPVHMAMMEGNKERVVTELHEAATTSQEREMAIMGAYRLIAEFDHDLADPRYVQMQDESIELMRSIQFSRMHLTGFENRRVNELGGW